MNASSFSALSLARVAGVTNGPRLLTTAAGGGRRGIRGARSALTAAATATPTKDRLRRRLLASDYNHTTSLQLTPSVLNGALRQFVSSTSGSSGSSASASASASVSASASASGGAGVPRGVATAATAGDDASGDGGQYKSTKADSKATSEESHQNVPFTKILALLAPEVNMIAVALAGITVSAGATMAFPNAIGEIIDILQAGVTDEGAAKMQYISLTMLGIFTAGAAATFVHSTVLEIVGQRVGARLRKKMFARIMEREMSFFDKNRVGELANRLSTDVHEVAEHLVENVASFLENAVKAISAIVAMLLISPSLTFTASVVVPAVAAGGMFYGRFIKKLSRRHLDALASSTQIAAERFGAIRTVVSFGQGANEVKRYSDVISDAYSLARKVALFQGSFMATSYLVGNGALLLVLWLGGKMVMVNALTAGTLASFCMYAGHLAVSVGDLTESISGFLRAQGSGSRLFTLLEGETKFRSGHLKLDSAKTKMPEIKFENVSFAYPTSAHKVLRDLTMTIKPGEVIAITGRSGCGKSTLAALLERLYEPDRGRITFGGIELSDFDANWLRSQIGTVQQEPILFAMSIRANIAYGREGCTDEDIYEVARLAHIHDFIVSLPDGYETLVGERGLSMSGGQKQRIAVARALLGDPQILVFDEATSALDTESEHQIHKTLKLLVADGNRACVIIAHHISTLAAADHVVVLEDGHVVQSGAFTELMQQPGPFHNLMEQGIMHAAHPSAVTVPHGAHTIKEKTTAE